MKFTSSFILLFIILLSSCARKEAIKIDGSTTVLPVVAQASEAYKIDHPDLTIIVNAGGSGVGVNQIGEEKIHIGMSSRDITETEIEKYPNVKFNTITIGKDAVVPVVSSEIYNSGVTALTLEQIAKIYKGDIKNWNEVGGPDSEILCIDKEKSRGTRHVFMKTVMGNKEADAPGADLVLGSNNEEQTALVQSDAAIGMLSNAWINEDVVGLSIIFPDGSIVEPSLKNIINGNFPITRDLYLIVNGEAQGATKDFIDFILSPEGQKIVIDEGYVSINQ
ncbi:extracellular solute-binding protein [Flavobacteriaceae bacterium AU392]|nr:phosphate ABC transporter substrate-binding protein [Flavobacteriaceae bacterium]RKM84614.1 extracellular solute-binding protein [Flavobacteriaceae bacterium AU392]